MIDLINWREVNGAVIKLLAGHFKPTSESEAVMKYIARRQTEQSVGRVHSRKAQNSSKSSPSACPPRRKTST